MGAAELRELVREAVEEAFDERAASRGTRPDPEPLLSTSDLAKALGISRGKAHTLAKEGKIPFSWCGDERRFDLVEVKRALRDAPAPASKRAGPGRGKKRASGGEQA
jgi:excisionase family DNA binding protein